MQCFYRLVLVILFILAGGLFLAHLVGNRQPSSFAALFMKPDGTVCKTLCLYGVRPGTTTAPEAVSLLQTHPLTKHLQLAKFALFEQGPAHTTIILGPLLDGSLASISLNTYSAAQPGEVFPSVALPESGSLADIITILGEPQLITFTYDRASLYYMNEDVVVIVRTAPASYGVKAALLDTSYRVVEITLYKRPACPPYLASQFFQRWLGFTAFKRYARAATLRVPVVDVPILLP